MGVGVRVGVLVAGGLVFVGVDGLGVFVGVFVGPGVRVAVGVVGGRVFVGVGGGLLWVGVGGGGGVGPVTGTFSRPGPPLPPPAAGQSGLVKKKRLGAKSDRS